MAPTKAYIDSQLAYNCQTMREINQELSHKMSTMKLPLDSMILTLWALLGHTQAPSAFLSLIPTLIMNTTVDKEMHGVTCISTPILPPPIIKSKIKTLPRCKKFLFNPS